MDEVNGTTRDQLPSGSYEDRDDYILIRRTVQSEEHFPDFAGVSKLEPKPTWQQTLGKKVRKSCSCSSDKLKLKIISLFPIITWMSTYKKNYIIGDIISGITVGIVHVPQSLAFSLLAGLPAVFGLYTTFYPVLIYCFMGTSQHIAVGTFAVTSILTLGVVDRLVPDLEEPVFAPDNFTTTLAPIDSTMTTIAMEINTTQPRLSSIGVRGISEHDVERVKVAAALMFLAGVFQIIFGLCRLGLIADYLSGNLLQAYATGAAFHVVTSQLPAALGVNVKAFPGVVGMIKTWIEICKALPTCNTPTLVVSAISMLVLIVGRHVNMKYKDRLKMPIPVVIIWVIITIIISYFADLEGKYGIAIVKYIPIGFPPPALPNFSIMGKIIGDGIATAIVAFAINLSVAKLFALQKGYEIDPNQELLAYGMTNFIPSFFLCFPNAAALARCAIQVNTGGNTQIVGFITCVIVMVVLLALGPVFEPLPRSVLGCIIIVGLFTILGRFSELPALWRKSKYEFLIWVTTCLGVIVLGVDFGLFLGIGVAIITIIVRTQRPKCEILENVQGSEIYRPKGTFTNVNNLPEICIFKFQSCLYYANKELFKTHMVAIMNGGDDNDKADKISTVIIDFGSVAFIDMAGAQLMGEMYKKMEKKNIRLLIADCNHDCLGTLNRLKYFDNASMGSVFISIHDAVKFAQSAKAVEVKSQEKDNDQSAV